MARPCRDLTLRLRALESLLPVVEGLLAGGGLAAAVGIALMTTTL